MSRPSKPSPLTSTPVSKAHNTTPKEFFDSLENPITPMQRRLSPNFKGKNLSFNSDDTDNSDVAMKTANASNVSVMNVDDDSDPNVAADSLEGDENATPTEGDVSRERSFLDSKKQNRVNLIKKAAENRFSNLTPRSKADRMQRAMRQRGMGTGRRLDFDASDDSVNDDSLSDILHASSDAGLNENKTPSPKRDIPDQFDDSDIVIPESDDEGPVKTSNTVVINESNDSDKMERLKPINRRPHIDEQSFGSSAGSVNNPISIGDSSDEDVSKEPSFTTDELKSVKHLTRVQLMEGLKSLKTISLANAPDGGVKIRRRLALLEHQLENFPDDVQIIDELPGPSRAPAKPKLAQVDIDRYLTDGKRLYGGAMTHDRFEKVNAVTEEVVTRLHSSLEKAPENIVTESPDGLNVDLMMHQKHGLTWMLWRETQQPRGGILADDMGLGKTLSMISLILEQKNRRKASDEANETLKTEMKAHFRNDPDVIPAFATLVIAPASVIYQWEKEIENRVPNNRLKVYVFHGAKREMNPRRLAANDVVITTYNIISSELGTHKVDGNETDDSDNDVSMNSKKNKQIKKTIAKGINSPLTKVGWRRIILDEAHNIKNRKSLMSRGCCRLPAFSRWALTGTPIHNNLWDLFSLIRFLRVNPFGEEKLWKEFIMTGGQLANDRLNALVKGLLIRRTKNQLCPVTQEPLVDLKPRSYEVVEIELEGLEYMCYQHMFEASRQKAKEIINQKESMPKHAGAGKTIRNPFVGGAKDIDLGDNFQTMSCLLVLLLRLRQACVHMSLTKNAVDIDAFKEDGGTEADVIDELERTMGNISLGGDNNVMRNEDGTLVRIDDIFEKPYVSAKVKALLERLDIAIETGDKCVIVSQWTSMLDVVEWHVKKRKIEYTSITGAILTKDRQARVDSFNRRDGGAQVMLLSLTAGGVGLNLIGGNHLFLVDLHWNPALEAQACDRIYRMGQTKNVFIHKLICQETIEQRVLQLQETKKTLANGVLEGAARKHFKLTMNDMKYLFDLRGNRPAPTQKDGPYQGPNNVRIRE